MYFSLLFKLWYRVLKWNVLTVELKCFFCFTHMSTLNRLKDNISISSTFSWSFSFLLYFFICPLKIECVSFFNLLYFLKETTENVYVKGNIFNNLFVLFSICKYLSSMLPALLIFCYFNQNSHICCYHLHPSLTHKAL